MGLKSGSRDSGLDDESDGDSSESDDSPVEATSGTEERANEQEQQDAATQQEEPADQTATQRPTVDSLPYKLRRNAVNDGREQVPYFLRPSVIDREDELKETLEKQLGETVYKSDYREASMIVAQRNPSLVAAVLREWGYDLDSS